MKNAHNGVIVTVSGDAEVDLSNNGGRPSFVSSRQKTSHKKADLLSFLASGIGFLADAYDFFVIESVFLIIKNTSATPNGQDYRDLVVIATLVGAVIGQLGFGLGADFIGRRLMFLTTSALVIFGSLASACVGIGYKTTNHPFSIFYQLAICRFLLGVGIGGEYPLSATVSTESLEHDENELMDDKQQLLLESTKRDFLWFLRQKPNSIAAVFSLQGVGLLMSSAVVIVLLAIGTPLEATWRICLALGAIPSSIAFYLRWKMHESAAFKKAAEHFYSDTEGSTYASSTLSQVGSSPDEVPADYTLPRQTSLSFTTCQSPSLLPPQSADSPAAVALNAASAPSTALAATAAVQQSPSVADTPQNDITQPAATAAGNVQQLPPSTLTPPVRPTKRRSTASRFVRHCKKCAQILFTFRYALLGSSLSWFLIDVTLYGVSGYKTMLSETLLNGTKGSSLSRVNVTNPHDVRSLVLHSTAIGSIFPLLGIPGYIASVLFIHKTGVRRLQLYGFYLVALFFGVMSLTRFCNVTSLWSDISLLGLTFFSSNFGPNTTTYILPTQLYPTIVRATCHGFSAAMGKAGAAVGTWLLKAVSDKFGLEWVFLTCAVVALLGALTTHLFVKSDIAAKRILDEEEERLTLKKRRELKRCLANDVEVALFQRFSTTEQQA